MMEGVLKAVERLPVFFREKISPATATDQEEKESTLREIRAVSEKIRCVQSRFDLVCESDLVDSCIFELQSLNARYRFLLQKARQMGIRCKPFVATGQSCAAR